MSTGMDYDQEYMQLSMALHYLEKNRGLAKTLNDLQGVDDICDVIKDRLAEVEKHLTCEHGNRMAHHPDYDPTVDYCRECARLEWGDILCDELRGT